MESFIFKHVGLLPLIARYGLIVLAFAVFFFSVKKERNYKYIIIGGVLFWIIYPAILSVMQFFAWSLDPKTQILLVQPLASETPIPAIFLKLLDHKYGYFAFFVYGRFFLHSFLLLLSAFVINFLCKAITRYRANILTSDERMMMVIAALSLSWPVVVLFLPMVFLFLVLHSMFQVFVFKQTYTRMLPALCFALIISLIFGHWLLPWANLQVLTVSSQMSI